MKLLRLLSEAPTSPVDRILKQVNLMEGLTQADKDLVARRLREDDSDPFKHSTNILTTADLDTLGIDRDDVRPPSFATEDDFPDGFDPFDLSNDDDTQDGVSVTGTGPDDPLGDGDGTIPPDEDVPGGIADLNADPDAPAAKAEEDDEDEDDKRKDIEESFRPFPKRNKSIKTTIPGHRKPAQVCESLGGLSGLKKLQRNNAKGTPRAPSLAPDEIVRLAFGG